MMAQNAETLNLIIMETTQPTQTINEYNFEIYTCHPLTHETGWDIKFRSVFATSKEEARELLKQSPDFDCIILFNFGGMPISNDLELETLYNNGVRFFDRHSYMNNNIVATYKG